MLHAAGRMKELMAVFGQRQSAAIHEPGYQHIGRGIVNVSCSHRVKISRNNYR
jgi:hypothetical protein